MKLTKKILEIKLNMYIDLVTKKINLKNSNNLRLMNFNLDIVRVSTMPNENGYDIVSRFVRAGIDLHLEMRDNEKSLICRLRTAGTMRKIIFDHSELSKEEQNLYKEITKFTICDEVSKKLENF